MRRKSQLFKAILLLGVFFTSCAGAEEDSPGETKPVLQVEGFVTQPMPFDNKFVTTATLMANEQVELRAPISGQVLEINFKEGAKVREGQSIIRLDDRSWRAQLLGLTAELEKNEKDYERKKKLLDSGGSSEKDIEESVANIESLKSQITQLEVNIDLANVRAPFSGTIGMRNFSKGAYLREGDVITVLTESNRLKVDFSVPSHMSDNLQSGKVVKVIIDSDTLQAEIYAVSPSVDADSRTIAARAILSQNSDKVILPGTYAEVILSTDFKKDALLIPTQAVVPEINDQTVYLYKNGIAERRIVQTGNRNADDVHIIDGLAVGDTVIITGLLQIRQGMNVELQSVQNTH